MPPKKIDKGKGKAKAEADQAPTGELPKRIRTKSAKAKEAQTNAEAAEAARSKVKKVPIPSPLGLDAAVSGSYHLAFAPGNGPVEPALGPEQGLTTAADEHAPGLDLPAAAAICLDRHGDPKCVPDHGTEIVGEPVIPNHSGYNPDSDTESVDEPVLSRPLQDVIAERTRFFMSAQEAYDTAMKLMQFSQAAWDLLDPPSRSSRLLSPKNIIAIYLPAYANVYDTPWTTNAYSPSVRFHEQNQPK